MTERTTMKLALILATLCLATTAHAGGIAFYQPQKAIADSTDGKKNAEAEKADLAAKQTQLQQAQDAAKKSEAECDKTPMGRGYTGASNPPTPHVNETKVCKDAREKTEAATALGQRLQKEFDQRKEQDAEQLGARVVRIAAAVRKIRKLDALIVVYPGSDVAPGADLTAELTKRLDAGEGKTDEQAQAELRAKAATADREKARADAAEKKLAEAQAKAVPVPVAATDPKPKK